MDSCLSAKHPGSWLFWFRLLESWQTECNFRYMCVCHTLKHNLLNKKRLILLIIAMYPLAGLFTWGVPLFCKCTMLNAAVQIIV